MNLKEFTSFVKGGNIALGQKLSDLLSEDCNILEYTNDSVLFTKGNKLVIAKFNHNLTEAKLSPADILDNEVIVLKEAELTSKFKKQIATVVENLADGNYVDAEESFKAFCEDFYQASLLKIKFPGIFAESLSKNSKGYSFRKKATQDLNSFKSELFSVVSMTENAEEDAKTYANLVESYGHCLTLGRLIVEHVITDALLGNEYLAQKVCDKLYEAAGTLSGTNKMLDSASEGGYDLEAGKFPEESDEDIASEFPYEEEGEEGMESEEKEEPKEFSEFDPGKLSDEDVKTLHIMTLKGILDGMAAFIDREANNELNDKIPADFDVKLKDDIELLNQPDISDEDLSQIEARWEPTVSYFLDSDLYTPDEDMIQDNLDIDDVTEGEETPAETEENSSEEESHEAKESPKEEKEEHEKNEEVPEEEETV